ncbi:MMPL family transporter [Candidatus Solirubrobacter pratensis]|uniref:MMPL family transporter n=1 Tax=Candidatus Solirubrobacter pratensis TaxID=1298857 RepID=UPI000488B1A6|nr:MMPL family transporter [Candidatus Solirubrobacter pratensis]
MSRLFTLPAGRRGKWIVFAVTFVVFLGFASQGGKFQDAQKNEVSSFLPGSAESVKALKDVERFPGGEVAPAVIVYERPSGLTDADKRRIEQTVPKLNRNRLPLVGEAQPPVFARTGKAAIIVQPVEPGDGQGQKFQDAAQSIRDRAGESSGGLEVKLTGAAGFSLDAIKVFANINGSLLLVAALIVLVLLIVIYRSPIFWVIPFFTVLLAEGASRGFGYLLAEAGVTINGQSGGILPVLVFGAGTDYALLLVSRYREELRRHEDKHEAMAIALRSAGPAILASGLTVIAALLTLSIAEVNGTAGLGPIGAMGVALAMISMLTLLPAALTICGRNWFWPRIPHLGEAGVDETHGFWRRIGDRVGTRPRAVWVTGCVVLLILAANLVNLDTGLTSGNSFRGEVDSVQGQAVLARNFPAGAAAPTDVIVPDRGRAKAVAAALGAQRGVVSQVSEPVEGPPGARLTVTLVDEPYSTTALGQTPLLRRVAKQAGGASTLVGGPTAQEYDLRQSAARDNRVIIPLTLVVVFIILAVLLRALVAPLLLVLSVILSFGAALGTGVFVSDRIFGFPGVDPALPLLTFVFLVALGIDYNIFLMARVREEALEHGTREGTLRGLAVTGAVITGAGIVLAGTFGALAVLPLVVLTEIGFIVAFGVLLDTFIVRSVIVPAVVMDVGSRVWWPSRLARARQRA